MGLMLKLGQRVNKNGHGINMDELRLLLQKATVKVAGANAQIEVEP
jgi:hypothetical protein